MTKSNRKSRSKGLRKIQKKSIGSRVKALLPPDPVELTWYRNEWAGILPAGSIFVRLAPTSRRTVKVTGTIGTKLVVSTYAAHGTVNPTTSLTIPVRSGDFIHLQKTGNGTAKIHFAAA